MGHEIHVKQMSAHNLTTAFIVSGTTTNTTKWNCARQTQMCASSRTNFCINIQSHCLHRVQIFTERWFFLAQPPGCGKENWPNHLEWINWKLDLESQFDVAWDGMRWNEMKLDKLSWTTWIGKQWIQTRRFEKLAQLECDMALDWVSHFEFYVFTLSEAWVKLDLKWRTWLWQTWTDERTLSKILNGIYLKQSIRFELTWLDFTRLDWTWLNSTWLDLFWLDSKIEMNLEST